MTVLAPGADSDDTTSVQMENAEMSQESWIDLLGWIGAALLLVAYALVSTEKLRGASVPFQALNISGSALLIANTLYYGALPSALVNTVWIGIAVYTISSRRNRP